jgi:hypothetical protein
VTGFDANYAEEDRATGISEYMPSSAHTEPGSTHVVKCCASNAWKNEVRNPSSSGFHALVDEVG